MLAWVRDLTSQERRTMLAYWGGWTLDGWGLSTGGAGTIGTAS